MRRKRAVSFLRSKLPRAAQAAACLIAVLSIGAGVALAASREVRNWAAGVLTGTAVDTSGFSFGNEPLTRSITDGVELEGQLVLLEDGDALVLREGMDAEPARYDWKDRGARRLSKLVVCGNDLCVLFEDGFADEVTGRKGAFGGAWTGESFDRIGLGRVRFGNDGTFTVDALTYFDGNELFGPGAEGCAITTAAAGNGKLYFVAGYDAPESGGFTFGNRRARMFACDLVGLELTELPLPIENKDSPQCELFSDGSVFLAASTPAQVWRIEADGSCTRLAALAEGSPANGFAYSAASDTLYFQRDAAVCAAPHFDVKHAVRAALTCGSEGKGLLIGESSYAIIGGRAEVYRLEP